mmetsp:Transcript_10797/g.26664  ORF Transcript_10797/g.26664 Transcript_10797/m.26664 type:complete len:240 (-) Transcript_10797:665-1384(-)
MSLAPSSYDQHGKVRYPSSVSSIRALYPPRVESLPLHLHSPLCQYNSEPALELEVGITPLVVISVIDVPPGYGLDLDSGRGHEILAHFLEHVECAPAQEYLCLPHLHAHSQQIDLFFYRRRFFAVILIRRRGGAAALFHDDSHLLRYRIHQHHHRLDLTRRAFGRLLHLSQAQRSISRYELRVTVPLRIPHPTHAHSLHHPGATQLLHDHERVESVRHKLAVGLQAPHVVWRREIYLGP